MKTSISILTLNNSHRPNNGCIQGYNGRVVYELVHGDRLGQFAVDRDSGLLYLTQSLDREMVSSYGKNTLFNSGRHVFTENFPGQKNPTKMLNLFKLSNKHLSVSTANLYWYTANLYLGRCSTDLLLMLGHSVHVSGLKALVKILTILNMDEE